MTDVKIPPNPRPVAYMRANPSYRLQTCDKDAPGAFPVYVHPAPVPTEQVFKDWVSMGRPQLGIGHPALPSLETRAAESAGWVSVPVVPTEAMHQAAVRTAIKYEDPAEAELNCAEEVLDGFAAHLELEQTSFDCIGDYITAVVEATTRAASSDETELFVIWRAVCEEAEAVVMNGVKHLLLTEEMLVRVGGAIESLPASSDERIKAALADPVQVHAAMLRGEIAKPAIRDMLHVYGAEALARWDSASSDEQDARRYRWLRQRKVLAWERELPCKARFETSSLKDLDAAIDAAMKDAQETPK